MGRLLMSGTIKAEHVVSNIDGRMMARALSVLENDIGVSFNFSLMMSDGAQSVNGGTSGVVF